MPAFISFVQYMDLKHFLLWFVIPLVGMATRWGLRKVTGTDNLHGEFSSPRRLFPDYQQSSTFYYKRHTVALLMPHINRAGRPLVTDVGHDLKLGYVLQFPLALR